jgi:tetratricopeptide (TPR) repeat protein
MGEALERLFREVVDLPPQDRLRLLDQLAVPAEIRAELEALLRFDTRGDLTAMASVADVAGSLLDTQNGPDTGARCGAYVLVRRLGRGGMGTVFLGERTDGEVRQQVAIKFMLNAAVSAVSRDRFLQERQILASLQHAGIARLLDAGHTEGGHPYLAMEYVDGTPIDTYAERLSLREKLTLFLMVCDAVSFAHRNLVIHRDLKPSNILVDTTGQPKLLDFGIARIVDAAADPSVTREQIWTPEYASPEQVRGTAHTTATDTYSLGAVLYRLLTARSPHESLAADPEPIAVQICEREPPAPSRLQPSLPRDLDFVVLKALRKNGDERYASVDAFAEDIRACLDGRPVRARSGNAWYWTRKFATRHWLPVSAVAAVIAALAIGLSVAERQRRIAEHRFAQLRQLATRMLALDRELQLLPGSISTRRQVVAASMAYLDELGREARADQDLALELATGYLALAQVQGVPIFANLGEPDEAVASLRKADTFVQQLLTADRNRPAALLLAAHVEEALMIIEGSRRRGQEALAHTRRSGDYLDTLIRSGRASPADLRNALPSFANVSLSFQNCDEIDDALRVSRAAVELARPTKGQGLADALSVLAAALRLKGDLEPALAAIIEARRLDESIAFKSDMQRSFIVYGVLLRQGQILGADEGISLHRPDQAIEPLQRAFDLMDQLAAKDVNDATSRDRIATVGRQLADIVRRRDPQTALDIYDRAIARQRETKGGPPARRAEARLLANSSYPMRSLGRSREARARIAHALDLLRGVGDYPAPTIDPDREAAAALRALADDQAAGGDMARALSTHQELMDKVLASHPNQERDLRAADNMSRLFVAHARLLRQAGRTRKAAEADARRENLWQGWDRRSPSNPYVRSQLLDLAAIRTPHD